MRDESFQAQGQELGHELSASVVMFHHAIAESLGLNATEHKCLEVLYKSGAMTAGQLAGQTGLTTGAITKIVDRLEKQGYARRERSDTDRRQVILHPIHNDQKSNELAGIYRSLTAAMNQVVARYSYEELEVIQDYLKRTIQVLRMETAKIQGRTDSVDAT